MIGLLVAVLGVGAAVGIVLGRGPVDQDPGTKPGGTSTAESPRPTAASSLGPDRSAPPAATPSPTAPSTPRPSTPEPTVAPTPTTGTGGTGTTKEAKARYVSVTIPTDWEVKANDYTLTAYPTVGGSLFLESGALNDAGAPKTTAAWIQGEIAWRQKQFPDVKICGAEEDFTVFNGPKGRAVTLCYTATTTTGTSYPAIVHVFGAIVVDGNETLLFHQKIYAKADIWKEVVAAVNPVLRTTQWSLFEGG